MGSVLIWSDFFSGSLASVRRNRCLHSLSGRIRGRQRQDGVKLLAAGVRLMAPGIALGGFRMVYQLVHFYRTLPDDLVAK